MNNILFIDDSEEDLELIKRFLRDEDLIIDMAMSVEETHEIFNLKKYHAVVIDWNLPDGTGLEAAHYIREKDNSILIIFVSGCFSEEMKKESQIYNPKACLEKDISFSYLKEILGIINFTI